MTIDLSIYWQCPYCCNSRIYSGQWKVLDSGLTGACHQIIWATSFLGQADPSWLVYNMCSTRPNWNGKITYTGNHLEIYRKSEILNYWFLGIFRLIFQEEILLEQEDVPIRCGEHQSLVAGSVQDIIFAISLGFPKTWLRVVGIGARHAKGNIATALAPTGATCNDIIKIGFI